MSPPAPPARRSPGRRVEGLEAHWDPVSTSARHFQSRSVFPQLVSPQLAEMNTEVNETIKPRIDGLDRFQTNLLSCFEVGDSPEEMLQDLHRLEELVKRKKRGMYTGQQLEQAVKLVVFHEAAGPCESEAGATQGNLRLESTQGSPRQEARGSSRSPGGVTVVQTVQPPSFEEIDTNGDGVISKDEYKVALQNQADALSEAILNGPIASSAEEENNAAASSSTDKVTTVSSLHAASSEEDVCRWVDSQRGFENLKLGTRFVEEGFGLYASFITLTEKDIVDIFGVKSGHARAMAAYISTVRNCVPL